MHFQIALASEHVAGFGCVPFRELGGWLARVVGLDSSLGLGLKSASSPILEDLDLNLDSGWRKKGN